MNRLKELRKKQRLTQQALADFLGISQNTYSYWENDKVKIDNQSLVKLSQLYKASIDYILGNDSRSPKGIKIPVLGRIQAGIPVEAIQEIIDYEEIPSEFLKKGSFFALQIKGDSMEPKFSEGDVVIVREQADLESGEVGVVIINGSDATIKKVVKHQDGISLIPTNSMYSPMFYTNKEVAALPLQIVGKVVELRAKF